MEKEMAGRQSVIIADNIVSPLGFSSEENYAAVRRGRSALRLHEGLWGIPEPFVASLFDREKVLEECEKTGVSGRFTFFEKIVILSVAKALTGSSVDPSSPRVQFILSTTKGNVDMLRANAEGIPAERELPGVCAAVITRFFNNPNTPIVVSNACISGVCAQICAKRLLGTGRFDYVVVCGADVQSPFIISGFQSFKALSCEACKPFDKERNGLNLGEAAATVIYAVGSGNGPRGAWTAARGAIRNDANHISGPSRTGEGSYRCLRYVTRDVPPESIAFINAHGTATAYNDAMEAVAIDRAGLSAVPVNSLKGYYGHTMGAAGVLETIISMCAADDGTVLGTRGFGSLGVDRAVNVSSANRATAKRSFIKLISGFGGCNAAMLFNKTDAEDKL